MKKIVTACFLVLHFLVSAQEKEVGPYPVNKLSIKWSPLHLFDFHSTFQVALEYRVARNISIQYDFGTTLQVRPQDHTYTDQEGFKAKLQVRYYIRPVLKHFSFYVGPEVGYNREDYKKSEIYRVSSHYEFITYSMQYRERSAAIKIGVLFRKERFCADLHIGVAGEMITYTSINKPTGEDYKLAESKTPLIYDVAPVHPYEKNLEGFYPTLGFKIGYVLIK